MSQITLYCKESPSLKLGPGTTQVQPLPVAEDERTRPAPEVGDCIVFFEGFATFDPALLPDWEKWVNHPGTPYIEVLGDNSEGQVPDGAGVACDVCHKSFATQPQLRGHMLGHAKAARREGVTA